MVAYSWLASGKKRKTNWTLSPYLARRASRIGAYWAQNGHWKSEYSITDNDASADPNVMSWAPGCAALEGTLAAAPVKRYKATAATSRRRLPPTQGTPFAARRCLPGVCTMAAVYRSPRARRSSRRADQRAAGATCARIASNESGGSPSVAYAAAPDELAGALSWLVLKMMTGVGSPQPWRSATARVETTFPRCQSTRTTSGCSAAARASRQSVSATTSMTSI